MPVFYPNCKATLSIIFDGFGGDDSNPTVIEVLPTRASANLNSYKEADTFSLEFDARQLPLSPELIRGAEVKIYMYETSSLQDAANDYRNADNLVVAGLIDNSTLSYSGEGSSVSFDGRDYTSLFIDKSWPTTKKVPTGVPLDVAIDRLSKEAQDRIVVNPDTGKRSVFKPLHPLNVEYIAPEPAPVVSAQSGRDKKLTQKTAKGKAPTTGHGHSTSAKKGIPFKSGQNYWDVMVKLCLRHGKICYVRGTTIVISDPKTLQESSLQTAPKMALGRNLESFSIERHLGRETVPQIVIVSYDKSTRRSLEARYPKQFKGKQTGFGTFKEEERRYTLYGISDVAILQELARTLYHNLGRSEGRMRFTTRDLRDLGANGVGLGTNSLLRVRAGDAVAVSFDPFNTAELRTLTSVQQRVGRLRELGYTDQVAQFVAVNYEHLKNGKRPWYTKHVMLAFDAESGIQIDLEGVNFIAAERDNAA